MNYQNIFQNQMLGEQPVETATEDEECEYDEIEKLAREKLSVWQERQVARSILDNTINRVRDNYILNRLVGREFLREGGGQMEDTAVRMAIRHHGLVSTTETESLSPAHFLTRWSSTVEHSDFFRDALLPLPGSSADLQLPTSSEVDHRLLGTVWNEDKMDETDREQDFLERAVAEAIKKKGLSVLSVDYG